jgi:type II secretory pathway component PulJ
MTALVAPCQGGGTVIGMLRAVRRPGRRRGFTLVELAVASTLGLVMILLALSLVAALVSAHATNVSTNAVQRDLGFVTEQMRKDFNNAQVCDPGGLGVPLRNLTESEAQLWVDTNADGKLDVIWWRWSDGQLQRAVVPGDGTCTFSLAAPQWRTYADNVDDPATDDAPGPLFSGRYHGTAVVGYPSNGCGGTEADNCLFDEVEVSFAMRSATVGRAFPSSATFPLDLSGSRILR